MIEIEIKRDHIVIPIKATPGAKHDEIRGVRNGCLRVHVTQAAEKGKANKAIIRLLSKSLRLRKSHLEIISGETSTSKKIAILDVTAEEFRKRIERIIG